MHFIIPAIFFSPQHPYISFSRFLLPCFWREKDYGPVLPSLDFWRCLILCAYVLKSVWLLVWDSISPLVSWQRRNFCTTCWDLFAWVCNKVCKIGGKTGFFRRGTGGRRETFTDLSFANVIMTSLLGSSSSTETFICNIHNDFIHSQHQVQKKWRFGAMLQVWRDGQGWDVRWSLSTV